MANNTKKLHSKSSILIAATWVKKLESRIDNILFKSDIIRLRNIAGKYADKSLQALCYEISKVTDKIITLGYNSKLYKDRIINRLIKLNDCYGVLLILWN